MYIGALPHTPLKKLFEKSFLRIFKNFEKGINFRFFISLCDLGKPRSHILYGINPRRGIIRRGRRLRRPAYWHPDLSLSPSRVEIKLRRFRLRDITEVLFWLKLLIFNQFDFRRLAEKIFLNVCAANISSAEGTYRVRIANISLVRSTNIASPKVTFKILSQRR